MDPLTQQPTQPAAPVMPPVAPTPVAPVTPPQQPMTPPPAMMMPEMPKEGKHWGPIIGAIVILALLVVAASYVWGQKLNNDADKAPKVPEAPVTQVQTTTPAQPAVAAEPQDDFTEVEANLNSSFEGLDDSSF